MQIFSATRLNDERGSVVVEMGLVTLPMVSLIMILVLCGIALNIQMSLTNAAREGVRIFALQGGTATPTWQSVATQAAGLSGVTVTGGRTTGPGTCTLPDHAGTGVDVFVSVSRPFNWTLPAYLGGGELGFGASNPLRGRAVMRCGG
jgi:Flp pilus assembly protein TadG